MSDLDDVLEYRRRLDASRRVVAQHEGRLAKALEDLSTLHACRSEQAGLKLLRTLKQRQKNGEDRLENKIITFEKKWKDKLE